MGKVNYKSYTPLALGAHPVTILADADEYFQDVAAVIGSMTEPKIFVTSWILKPTIMLNSTTSFEGLIANAVKKTNGACYILWNTLVPGITSAQLFKTATSFQKTVKAALPTGVKLEDKLKIVFSTNLDYALGTLFDQALAGFNASRVISAPPTDKRNFLQRFFFEVFSHQDPLLGSPLTWGNGAPPVPGSTLSIAAHHQKTVVASGKIGGTPRIVAWCGGLDFGPGPAGFWGTDGSHNGGAWWHDYAIRVRGEAAVGVLENFVNRWNRDITSLDTRTSFGVSDDDDLDEDDFYDDNDEAMDSDLDVDLTLPNGFDPTARVLEIRDRYMDLVDDAEDWIFIENQYFRHRDLAEKIADQLDDEDNLNVTIVIPAYPEEIKNTILPKLRDDYGKATTQAKRDDIMTRVRKVALTIDPMSKLMVRLQNECLGKVIDNARVRVWIPSAAAGRPYIHSKMMAVDDLGITVGSANTNKRSFEGTMDTEINVFFSRGPSTDTDPDVKKLRDRFGWRATMGNPPVPLEDEKSPGYAASYYGKHNLVRYRRVHWDVDKELGSFPKGKKALVDYLFAFRASKQLEGSPLKDVTRAQIESYLDSAPNVWFDIETDDLGKLLLEYMEEML